MSIVVELVNGRRFEGETLSGILQEHFSEDATFAWLDPSIEASFRRAHPGESALLSAPDSPPAIGMIFGSQLTADGVSYHGPMAPVASIVSDGKPLTGRQLLLYRTGLVRTPPRLRTDWDPVTASQRLGALRDSSPWPYQPPMGPSGGALRL
jgi:hypothetical protein